MTIINGTAGSDTLSGRSGDMLIGGSGDDTYIVDATGILVSESDTGGGYGAIKLLSTTADGLPANGHSFLTQISATGGAMLFYSYASNLIANDANGTEDYFVKDLATGTVTLVNSASDGSPGNGRTRAAVLSPDGSRVAFSTTSDNLALGDTNGDTSSGYDIFLKDLTSGTTTLISATADGLPGDGTSVDPQFSPDGSKIVFASSATNLAAGAPWLADRLYIKDLTSGAISLLPSTEGSSYPQFSPDGARLMFWSASDNLVPGDSNGAADLFVVDIATNAITRVSCAADGTLGDGDNTWSPGSERFSADGSKVAFLSQAGNLVPGDNNNAADVFVKDLASGAIVLVNSAADGTAGNAGSTLSSTGALAFSPDGSRLVFGSSASNLVPGDTNGADDIFVKDLVSGALSRVSTDASGTQGNLMSAEAQFSPDGKAVLFVSAASNLVPGDANGSWDVFIKDLASGAISLVSRGPDGPKGNGNTFPYGFSADGSQVFLGSLASNFVPGDSNGSIDIFAKDLAAPAPGIDTVEASITYSLAANVENLVLLGSGSINGTGNLLDNTLTGNDGANTLDGGAGNDLIDGGAGFDTAVFSGTAASYSITRGAGSIIVSGADGTDTLIGIERLQFADGTIPLQVAASDFDGDGKSDVLWRNTVTGADVAWKSANSATTLAVKTLADQNWLVAGTGDFDGDGKNDILWRNLSTGGNNIWKGAESTTAQATAAFTDLNWKVAGIGDFNGDGKSDILWRNSATATNKIWLSANSATVQTVAKTANLDWQVAGIGDFDGDGKSDILWRNGATGGNLVWKGASSTATLRLATQNDLAWKVAGVGDFNGDGKSDILWRNGATGANKIWLAGSGANVQTVTTAGVAWQVVGTGDYDGDGRSDILWRNTTTAACNIWKGGSSTASQSVTARPLDNAVIDGVNSGDLLFGGTGNNRLVGTLGSDSMNGGAGNDTLYGGGGGKDTMVGGSGNDTFVIDRVAALTAAISDFVAGQDKLGLGQSAYGGLFSAGVLNTGVFATGSSDTFATTAQRLQYNAASGALWYDSDGTGAAAAVQIATLGSVGARPSVAASDFTMLAG